MDIKTQNKLYENALIGEKLSKLTIEEKRDIILTLLSNTRRSERQLAKDIGIPHTTLHGWKTMKENDKNGRYLSLNLVIKKLEGFIPTTDQDKNKLIKINKLIEVILYKMGDN